MSCKPIRQPTGSLFAEFAISAVVSGGIPPFVSDRFAFIMLAESVTGTWRAHRTLEAGCRFMARRADEGAIDGCQWGEVAHARLLGNRLLELDRFLSVLIDETLCVTRRGDGKRAASRLRNTAHKLHPLDIMPGSDDARLRAIGRIAAVFRHCDGLIHNAAIHDDMRLAEGLQPCAARTGARGTRLYMAPMVIVAICDFYREIGGRLLALAGRSGAAP